MTQWMEIKILTKYSSADAVGEILYRNKVNGLVYEDLTSAISPPAEISWDYLDVSETEQPEEVKIVAYLPLEEDILAVIEEIKAEIELLQSYKIDIGKGLLSYKIVDEKDWKDNWKKFFKPVHVGCNIIVRPVWEELDSDRQKTIINIDPGLAFGTGSHITTQQALIMLEKNILNGCRVIDVGCGSGILSIAAHLLGAGSVVAIDNDDQAVAMAESNIKINNIPNDEITVVKNDLLQGINTSADIIAANITAPVLKRLIPQAAALTLPDGLLICAGIIKSYEYEMQQTLIGHKYVIIDRLEKGDWVALTAQKVL